MLLVTSRVCARSVTFYNNFDKYSGREEPEGDVVFSNILQLPTGSVHVRNSIQLSSVVCVEFRVDRRF